MTANQDGACRKENERKPRKSEAATESRRIAILDAAFVIFMRKGFAAATIPEIAREAKVAVGTIYLYFPNKRELFTAVIEKLIIKPIIEMLDRNDGGNAQETLFEILKDRLAFIRKSPLNRFAALMSEIIRDPQLKALFKEKAIGPFLKRMERTYAGLAETTGIHINNPALLVRFVGSLIIGTVVLKSIEEESSPLDKIPPDELAEEFLNFLLFGLSGSGSQDVPGKEIV
jgi:AcrR family transcriptional regulator